MGQFVLVVRFAVRDVLRRPLEAALLLVAMVAATTALTLGLVLQDAASDPYRNTREATLGPDVVALAGPAAGVAELERLADASGVESHSGPFLVIGAELDFQGVTADVQVIGRDDLAAAVDQPLLVAGDWARAGAVVVEAGFAASLEVGVGDEVVLNGRRFRVVGIAVTAAMAPYPKATCVVAPGCINGAVPDGEVLGRGLLHNPGLVWLTDADTKALAPDLDRVSHVINLQLADPAAAGQFVDAHAGAATGGTQLISWQDIRRDATELARDFQVLLLIGAWLLGVLAMAGVSVLVGGRLADQTRRVGLLKAVGGTPGFIAAVLLAEYALVAAVAALVGLGLGSLAAPALVQPGAGLLGNATVPELTASTAGWVFAAAFAVPAVATAFPARRAARTPTTAALADAARPPRRVGWLIGVAALLPVPLLLALRVAARRPRRALLSAISVAITVSGIYVALVLNSYLASQPATGGYDTAQVEALQRVLVVVTAMVVALAATNSVVIAWTTVLDNQRNTALTRALGATANEVSGALALAQVLPAFTGAVLGIFPGGVALLAAINAVTGGDGGKATQPPLWQLLAVITGTMLAVTALTALPARLGSRRPIAPSLHARRT